MLCEIAFTRSLFDFGFDCTAVGQKCSAINISTKFSGLQPFDTYSKNLYQMATVSEARQIDSKQVFN